MVSPHSVPAVPAYLGAQHTWGPTWEAQIGGLVVKTTAVTPAEEDIAPFCLAWHSQALGSPSPLEPQVYV